MAKRSLENFESFGDVAAENDSVLLDYFVTTPAISAIKHGKTLLVLGRKGCGKTALVRYFTEQPGGALASKSLTLRGYPWALHGKRRDAGASEIEAYVSSWRYLIVAQLAVMTLGLKLPPNTQLAANVRQFLLDNYGTLTPDPKTLLQPSALKCSSASFEPQVMGNKIGVIRFDRDAKDAPLGTELNALTDLILAAVKLLTADAKVPSLFLHFDELDQGLSKLTAEHEQMLVGLILAARDIRLSCQGHACAIAPVVYLRTDIWSDLRFSDKNKITQSSTLALDWDKDSLLRLVHERLRLKLDSVCNWDDIEDCETMRGGQSKWNHIMARTFLRPRDVIQFLNAALRVCQKRADRPLVFVNGDIIESRTGYSNYLRAELDDEIGPHWKEWEQALRVCSALGYITFERGAYIKAYEEMYGSPTKTAAESLELLYNFSVIGYEQRSGYGGSGWVFNYTHPQAGWNATVENLKVHLGLIEYARLKEERRA